MNTKGIIQIFWRVNMNKKLNDIKWDIDMIKKSYHRDFTEFTRDKNEYSKNYTVYCDVMNRIKKISDWIYECISKINSYDRFTVSIKLIELRMIFDKGVDTEVNVLDLVEYDAKKYIVNALIYAFMDKFIKGLPAYLVVYGKGIIYVTDNINPNKRIRIILPSDYEKLEKLSEQPYTYFIENTKGIRL